MKKLLVTLFFIGLWLYLSNPIDRKMEQKYMQRIYPTFDFAQLSDKQVHALYEYYRIGEDIASYLKPVLDQLLQQFPELNKQ